MKLSPEARLHSAIGDHWLEVTRANDELLALFMDTVRELCPDLKFQARAISTYPLEGGLAPGSRWALALSYCRVELPADESGPEIWVEIHCLSDPTAGEREIDWWSLLHHLGALDD